MFFYSSNRKFPSNLTVHQLSSGDTQLIRQAAIWAEDTWGYLRGYVGYDEKTLLIERLLLAPNEFYMVFCSRQPIGMFLLRSWQNKVVVPELDLEKTKELDYVYIDSSLRGLGVGGIIVEKAKQLAKSAGATLIVLDTLEPKLNQFYIKHGAKLVCENQHREFQTDKLHISL